MSFLLSSFLLSQFPARWSSCHFPCTGFSSCSTSTTGAFAELGSCYAWPPPCGGCAEVVSARLNRSHGTIDVKGVGNFLSSVSSQQKSETDRFIALGQISVTAPCYSSILFRKQMENTSLRHEGMPTQKTCFKQLLLRVRGSNSFQLSRMHLKGICQEMDWLFAI